MINDASIILFDYTEFNVHYVASGVNHPSGHPRHNLRSGRTLVILKPLSKGKDLDFYDFFYNETTFNGEVKEIIEKSGEDVAFSVTLRPLDVFNVDLEPQYRLTKTGDGWTLTRATPFEVFALGQQYRSFGLETPPHRVKAPNEITLALHDVRIAVKEKEKENVDLSALYEATIRIVTVYESGEHKVSDIDYGWYNPLYPSSSIEQMGNAITNTINTSRCSRPIGASPVLLFKIDFLRKEEEGEVSICNTYILYDDDANDAIKVIKSNVSSDLLKSKWANIVSE